MNVSEALRMNPGYTYSPVKIVDRETGPDTPSIDFLKQSPEDIRESKEEASLSNSEELTKAADRFNLRKEESLTLKEKMELQELQQTERNVQKHEQAHMRSARNLALSGPNYQYELGPDGKKYVVHGEINIDADISTASEEETIEKARRVQQAALAPNDPSSKDQQSAVKARIIESKAYRKQSRNDYLDVIIAQKEQRSEEPNEPKDFGEDAAKELGLDPYRQNLEFQKNLSSMLDLFT